VQVKAVVTDIDGTLTDDQLRLSPVAIKAIRKLERAGIPVTLASGNALCVVKTLKTYVGATGAVICENGAVVEYDAKLEVLGNSKKAIEALRLLKRKFKEGIIETWSNRYRYVDVAIKRKVKRDLLEKYLSGLGVRLLDSGFAYHILDEEVSKAGGLKVACDLMGINLHEVAAVGDSEVDAGMLKLVGFKIALANAPESLKNLADYVTSKTYGEGFAEAVEVILSKTDIKAEGSRPPTL
jgi:hypothetical protein